MHVTGRLNTLIPFAQPCSRGRETDAMLLLGFYDITVIFPWPSDLDNFWLLQNHEWISGDWQVFSAYPLMSDGQALQVHV